MKLRIFDMETDVVFSDQYVNVLEIENRAYLSRSTNLLQETKTVRDSGFM